MMDEQELERRLNAAAPAAPSIELKSRVINRAREVLVKRRKAQRRTWAFATCLAVLVLFNALYDHATEHWVEQLAGRPALLMVENPTRALADRMKLISQLSGFGNGSS